MRSWTRISTVGDDASLLSVVASTGTALAVGTGRMHEQMTYGMPDMAGGRPEALRHVPENYGGLL